MKVTTKKMLVWGLAGAIGVGALSANAEVAQAQPDPNAAPKTENPANRQRPARMTPEERAKAMQDEEIAAIEKATGKTLTDAQKQDVRTATAARQAAVQAAQEVYLQDLSKATGIEVDELKMKMRGMRGRNGKNGQAGQNGKAGKNGRAGKNGKNGKNGRAGKNGKNGADEQAMQANG